jgi:homogentisate 1,2-dioxygenase
MQYLIYIIYECKNVKYFTINSYRAGLHFFNANKDMLGLVKLGKVRLGKERFGEVRKG